jgi:N-acetylglucosamine transport system permease protein
MIESAVRVAPPSPRRRGRRRVTFDKASFMAVFLGLPLVLFLGFVVWPIVQAFWYSMTDWSGFTSTMNFIGLRNYHRLVDDDVFMKAVRNNILLALVVPFVTIALAFTLATLVTIGGSSRGAVRGLRNSSFYRIISFFPHVIPAIIIGLLWAQMFDPSNGLLNGVLTKVGLSGFDTYPWLGDTRSAMPASMFVIIWGFVGFYMVLFIAAIKGIPAELYDAARIDGAGRLRMAFKVTIPMVLDTVQTAYIYIGIFALDAFVYMTALNSGGGPENSTLTMSQDLFKTAFEKGQFGLASAMGVVMALATLLFAAIVFIVVFIVNQFIGGRRRARG